MIRLRHSITYQQTHRAPAPGILEDSGEFGITARGARLRTQKIQSAESAPGERGMRVCGLRWRDGVCWGRGPGGDIPREGREDVSPILFRSSIVLCNTSPRAPSKTTSAFVNRSVHSGSITLPSVCDCQGEGGFRRDRAAGDEGGPEGYERIRWAGNMVISSFGIVLCYVILLM
jgi:hypothetical protein